MFLEQNQDNAKVKELNGKMVLLGGSYRDFDRHLTPLGKQARSGVEILANAIQTELDDVNIPLLSSVFGLSSTLTAFIIWDLSIGCLVLLVFKSAIARKKKDCDGDPRPIAICVADVFAGTAC
jgi:hypothetical protein